MNKYLSQSVVLLIALAGCSPSVPSPQSVPAVVTTAPENRIVFPGNPWPKGHIIKEFVWSARLEPTTGIWCQLHLKSDDYDAEDLESDKSVEGSDADNWRSKIVWNNYQACILSATQWDDAGFLVGTRDAPFDLESLSGKPLTVDPLPFDLNDKPAFGIYLQGHDFTAGHRILFTKSAADSDWTVDWQGSIALTYLGDDEFRHRFVARKSGVHFDGIYLPANTPDDQAAQTLAPFVRDVKSYILDKTPDGELRFVYTGEVSPSN
jgi:hypothetical protein